ncbi:MAG TPA: cytochrome c-type biogenesis protein CcmH [Anaerolineales bacterium]
MRQPLAALLLAGLLAASAPPTLVAAQAEEPTEDEVNAIAKGLYCPVCENVPLDVCPTLACKQWRETIREKLALGWNQEQIEQYFVEQYGDRVLATPPAHGLNWAVYLIPPAVFLAGAAVLVGAMRAWRRPPVDHGISQPAAAEDPYLDRLEEELRARG